MSIQSEQTPPASFQYLERLVSAGPVQGGGADPLSYHVLQLLLEYQNDSAFAGDLCEIGVWRGDTLALLATASRDKEKTIAIDIGDNWLKKSSELAMAACSDYGISPTICSIQGSSSHPSINLLLQQTVGSQGIRFAHIDGEHSRELALSDAELVNAFMAPWGLICFDDCPSIACPGVAQAFFEFSSRTDWDPLLFTPNKSYVCHKRYVKIYREYIISIIETLCSTRSITASMSSSSYYPDEGFISIYRASSRYYQVVNMQYPSFDEYISHKPRKLDISACKILD